VRGLRRAGRRELCLLVFRFSSLGGRGDLFGMEIERESCAMEYSMGYHAYAGLARYDAAYRKSMLCHACYSVERRFSQYSSP
jgi:hypothetical protein